VVLARGIVIGLPLALDGENAVHYGQPDFLRIHARQGELNDVDAVLEAALRGGEPRRNRWSDLIRGTLEEPREQVLDVVVMEMELLGGGPTHTGGHGGFLSLSPSGLDLELRFSISHI